MSTEMESRDSRLLIRERSRTGTGASGFLLVAGGAIEQAGEPAAATGRRIFPPRSGTFRNRRSLTHGAVERSGSGCGLLNRRGRGLWLDMAGEGRGRRVHRHRSRGDGRCGTLLDHRRDGRDGGLVDPARLNRRRRIDHAVGPRDEGGQFVERLDLVGDHAAHVGGGFLRLLRQLDDAPMQFGAGVFELALDLPGHAAHLVHGVAELRRRVVEGLGHFGGGLLVGAAKCGRGALAFLARGVADAFELLADRVGGGFGGIGQHRADLAGLRLGILQRAFHQRGEGTGDGFEIFGARGDAAEQVVERLLSARQGGAHAAFRLFEG